MQRILVVGATGMIGAPVAGALRAAALHVRLLIRDSSRACALLGSGFDYVEGSVTDHAAVHWAVRGMDGVHVGWGVDDPAQLGPAEHRGRRAVAQAAARHGLQRISYLTASSASSSSLEGFPRPLLVGSVIALSALGRRAGHVDSRTAGSPGSDWCVAAAPVPAA